MKLFIFLALILINACNSNPTTRNEFKFAWIVDSKTVEGVFANDKTVDKNNIYLTNHLNQNVKIESITQQDSRIVLTLNSPLNLAHNYILNVNGSSLYTYPTLNLLNTYFHYNDELGPTYQNKIFKLKIWSPTATKMSAVFFDKKNSSTEIGRKSLELGEQGVWSLTVSPKDFNLDDLHRYFYQLEVTSFGKTKVALDPYAKSLASFNHNLNTEAKAAIIDLSMTNPPGFTNSRLSNKDVLTNPVKFIGYEAHVRDFTIDPSLNIPSNIKGTYIGFTKIIPHLQELGITHVQFQPIQSFYHINDTRRSYQGSSVPTEDLNYNWGYDPHQFFSPEGWYSTNPTDPAVKIFEFKQLVQELHKSNIGVIIDVVYNHLPRADIFEKVAPGCYFRRNIKGEISLHSGAGSTVEDRILMVRKLIIDSLNHFKKEYHVNGFRFDLMGFLSNETMIEIRKKLGSDTILYGEAWEFTDLPSEVATTKSNLPEKIGLGAFNDSSRNSYTGEMANRGFIQGAYLMGPQAKAGIIGSIKNYPRDYDNDGVLDVFMTQDSYHLFADGPINTLNYLTIHDGFTLWDKINLTIDASDLNRIQLVKMALGMLLTSQGRIVLHGGSEMARSKPLSPNDPEKARAHTSQFINPDENGVTYFHENTYKSPDITNMINWKRKKRFSDIFQYTKGLIKLRKSINSFSYSSANNIKRGLRFISEKVPDQPDADHPFDEFHQLDSLTINFRNGVPNSQSYLAGEVHPVGTSKNPIENPWVVNFNKNGEAQIMLSKNSIESFDLKAWSDPSALQLKLVNTPGKWDFHESQYSPMGNNTLRPIAINIQKNITVDLGTKDFSSDMTSSFEHNKFIAYILDNTLEESNSPYKNIFVVHNADDKTLKLELNNHKQISSSNCDILVDSNKAGTNPIENSSISFTNRNIFVPSKSNAVLGCY